MAGKALNYIVSTLTQGSADAFVQNSVTTGLAIDTRTAFRIREITLEMGVAGGASTNGLVANAGYDCGLTRTSKSAAAAMSDRTLIWKYKHKLHQATSGAALVKQIDRTLYGDDEVQLIVEPTIYLQLDSDGSSAANVFIVRIGYEIQAVSDIDRLTIIQNTQASL